MVNLKKTVADFLEKNVVDYRSKKYLIAWSGGLDSTLMVHAFLLNDLHFAAAHCNFNLRGAESNRDEEFVTTYANQSGVVLFVEQYDTEKYAKGHHLSTQEAARELRYDYFQRLCKKHAYDFVVTAHHADDQMETFFINLVRGSGLNGLSSIKPVRENLLRPFLQVSRTDLELYASEHDIPFVEDSSNAGNKYLRNRIRHDLIPVLDSLRNGAKGKILASIENIQFQEYALNNLLEEKLESLKSIDHGIEIFDFTKVTTFGLRISLLRFLLAPYGFGGRDLRNIALHMGNPEERLFSSGITTISTKKYLLRFPDIKNMSPHAEEYLISDHLDFSFLPFAMDARRMDGPREILATKNEAWFDAGKLEFPLKIRRFRAGDKFLPFGMKGRVKLSDYFTNRKFNMSQKENIWIMESAGEIIWIIGERVGQNCVADNQTQQILLFKYASI